jgi:CO/xanthine dehydrogenase Mo-binding subunit
MSYAGQPLKRFEDPKLVTGRGSYVDDVQLPGMLHAAVLRSPHAHARIRSIDASAARHQPGVVTVLTGADTAGVLNDVPTRAMAADLPVDDMKLVEQPVLARGKVCYVGQPWLSWWSGPYQAQMPWNTSWSTRSPDAGPRLMAAMREDAIHTPRGWQQYRAAVSHEGGDVAAFAQADRVIQQRYHVQRLAPCHWRPVGGSPLPG